jgi:hypothetical protein
MKPRPGLDAGGLGQHIVAASGHLPKLGNRVGEIPPFCGVAHDGPVHGDARSWSGVDRLAAASSTILIDLPLI